MIGDDGEDTEPRGGGEDTDPGRLRNRVVLQLVKNATDGSTPAAKAAVALLDRALAESQADELYAELESILEKEGGKVEVAKRLAAFGASDEDVFLMTGDFPEFEESVARGRLQRKLRALSGGGAKPNGH